MPSWYPGQAAVGQKVFPEPTIFGQTPSFNKSINTGPTPVISTPSTVPSPGTVTNTTGYDCMVYASATTGIGSVKFTPGGSVSPGASVSASALVAGGFYVPAGSGIALTYTGTLTWLWLAV